MKYFAPRSAVNCPASGFGVNSGLLVNEIGISLNPTVNKNSPNNLTTVVSGNVA